MVALLKQNFWRTKRVLVTGHTGFKGAWLASWLHRLGAKVIGYALAPPSMPNLFDLINLQDIITSIHGDVRDPIHLNAVFNEYKPEIVFHLAAQALVRRSYEDPVETYSTNVMGTVNLLEAIRETGGVRAVIIVTSDKCYENNEWVWGYREIDPMGGSDPYASSKGCAELVANAYRQSFFNPGAFNKHRVALATVRAGNVIGGGDWGADRLIPDICRAVMENRPVFIRYPKAIRPWQHVLEPLHGYLLLAERLYHSGAKYSEAWNFGPSEDNAKQVSWMTERLAQLWGGGVNCELDSGDKLHEATYLRLDSSKARMRLGWRPQMTLEQALEWTVNWYKNYHDEPKSMREFTLSQITSYQDMD